MSPSDGPLSLQDYQARIAQLQADLQRSIQEAQSRGDFGAIAALSAKFQAETAALVVRLQASFAGGAAPAAAASAPAPADAGDALPKDDSSAWLMLLGAMYVEENGRLESLSERVPDAEFGAEGKEILTGCFCALDMGVSPAAYDPGEVRDLLRDSWSIDGKESLANTLAWLLKEGHHKRVKQLISYAKTNPGAEQRMIADYRARFDEPLAFKDGNEQDLRDALARVDALEKKLSPAGIRAWDLARYVHVLRLGYMGRLIKAGECWLHVKRLEEPALKTFTGWEDFAHSYVMGYRWWSGTAGPIEDACDRLLGHPRSPWNFFGWRGIRGGKTPFRS